MQQELCKSEHLTLAKEYHTKSVHADWDGKKAQANKFGRLCADEYLKALQEDMPIQQRLSVLWQAVMQHNEIRRYKIANELAQEALSLIGNETDYEVNRNMFVHYLNAQN